MRTSWKRLLPLGVILVIGVVQVCGGVRERAGSATACSPKALDLNAPVTAWFGS